MFWALFGRLEICVHMAVQLQHRKQAGKHPRSSYSLVEMFRLSKCQRYDNVIVYQKGKSEFIGKACQIGQAGFVRVGTRLCTCCQIVQAHEGNFQFTNRSASGKARHSW